MFLNACNLRKDVQLLFTINVFKEVIAWLFSKRTSLFEGWKISLCAKYLGIVTRRVVFIFAQNSNQLTGNNFLMGQSNLSIMNKINSDIHSLSFIVIAQDKTSLRTLLPCFVPLQINYLCQWSCLFIFILSISSTCQNFQQILIWW